jgi:DNA modification methylase
MAQNTLYYGDNLKVMPLYLKDESIDLIYLDPPFNSNADYNMLFAEQDGTRAAAQIKAFDDAWEWDHDSRLAYETVVEAGGPVADVMRAFYRFLGGSDMMAYLSMMAPRVKELHRVLKPTGSIYLHCDPTASHYLKLLLDAAFGPQHFGSEIIWKRTSGHSDALRYGSVHDTILFYWKSEEATWHPTYEPYEQDYIDQYYRYRDPDGRRFMSGDLGATGLQGGGYDYEWKGVRRVWRLPISSMQALDKAGKIFYTRNGIPRIKRYLDEAKGLPRQDIWTDIEALRSWHKEKLSYPTQKPVELLKRIISTSSNPGDVILDPFCGCGTTIDAAESINRDSPGQPPRRWIGIDITHLAINLIKYRLRNVYGSACTYAVTGEPESLPDAEQLAKEDKFQFQCWALGLVGAGARQGKKGADKGIDGLMLFHDDAEYADAKQVVFSVKGGENVGVGAVRDLRGVLDREEAQIGVLISLRQPTKPMADEAVSAGFYESPDKKKYPRIQLLTIEDLLSGKKIDMPPWAENRTFVKAPRAKLRKKTGKGLFPPGAEK